MEKKLENIQMDIQNDNTIDFVEAINRGLSLKEVEPLNYSSINLAYIGDDAYDLVIRTYLLNQGNMAVNKINKHANSLVKAETQSQIVGIIEPLLSEEELAVYKRGRNAKSYTSSKNASIGDYRRATGFEALIGYLYLLKRYDRMISLVKAGLIGIGEIKPE